MSKEQEKVKPDWIVEHEKWVERLRAKGVKVNTHPLDNPVVIFKPTKNRPPKEEKKE